ncbi:ArnT family glycosyltransferase [Actinopolymorpha alba]|uniref:ArnT family glycosyltransferase n=1 Tax=Actinopolymorpha alba TaxID=533267 RepID=UPI0003A33B97|nr:glycosyltransferase family 39 protein [Actinopolymorpha alba]
MTTATDTAARTSPVERQPGRGSQAARWPVWALLAICVASGLLYAWAIGGGQLGNAYYSAAVKSMSTSFTNFLFGSFDPYGVVTVDKPPMALWPQVVSVWIFGYHGWSLLLPQVIEGVATVFLLHRTVRLWAGEKVALLAALLLALTPITVAINRYNNPDTLLMLLLVAAAYAFTRSVHAGEPGRRTRWLLWCAFFIGCGFATKMLQAWIIVPGVAVAYFAGVAAPLRRRLVDLLAAGAVLVGSSFWWPVLHDLWPGKKPYMGGSTNGSALELVFGYNGLGRIFGQGLGAPGGKAGGTPGVVTSLPPGAELPEGARLPTGANAAFGGEPGITRMFDAAAGGQISWLLPLSLLVLIVVAVVGVRRLLAKAPGDPARRAGWLLWGSWLLVTGLLFSYAQGIWHPYYTTMLAPAIAAISAAGLALLWRYYQRPGRLAWLLLPLGIAISAGWAWVVVARDAADWHGWTRWAVVAVGAVSVAGLVVARLFRYFRLGAARWRAVVRPAFVAGLAAILLTPGVWSVADAANGSGGMPAAGPSTAGFVGRVAGGGTVIVGGPGPMPGQPGGQGQTQGQGQGQTQGTPGRQPRLMTGGPVKGSDKLTAEQRRILNYAKQHGDGAEITLAVEGGANGAGVYIIDSDETVIGMGGFSGSDNAPSVAQLQEWVSNGTLKFVLGASREGKSAGMPGGPGAGARAARADWIDQHCTVVDPAAYGGSADAQKDSDPMMPGGAQTLYKCGA